MGECVKEAVTYHCLPLAYLQRYGARTTFWFGLGFGFGFGLALRSAYHLLLLVLGEAPQVGRVL